MDTKFLKKLRIKKNNSGTSTGQKVVGTSKEYIDSYSPVDGKLIGSVSVTSRKDYDNVIKTSLKAFATWKSIPAPARGEVVRQYGNVLRDNKEALGRLVSY